MEDKQWLLKLSQLKNATRKVTIITKSTTQLNTSSTLDNDIFEYAANNEFLSSLSLLTLIILYGIVVFSGICGNSTLLISLCSQSTARVKNPLLLALCTADLLVSLVSAPLTIIGVILRMQSRTMSYVVVNIGCKAFHYLQSFPVAASSLCLLMLSLDRYVTVKHPRLAQLRQRQFLPSILAFLSWIGSAILCIPLLLVYRVFTASSSSSPSSSFKTTTTPYTASSTSSSPSSTVTGHQLISSTTFPIYRNSNLINDKRLCVSDYGSSEWHIVFIVSYVSIVFIIPIIGVIFNHIGVRRKLCALSLTARAQHGELPLPMPTILRRPTHMILVTGMTPNGLNVPDSSHDDYLSPQKSSSRRSNGSDSNQCGVNRLNSNRRFNGSSSIINPSNSKNGLGTDEENRNLMAETRFRASPRTPRSIRRVQNQQIQTRLNSPPIPPAELPIPQTSTLRSRRRLANILVVAGFVFMACWSPHVICLIFREFSITSGCSNTVTEFVMLLGFAHSAVSPILHWVLNYNSLRQSACQPFAKLNSAQRFLRSHLRFTGPPPAPPSSTNEAALGPFNPRFIKQRPQVHKPPASSHYLY
ncbi:cholecystokinin receptor-like [Chironomus tepperi]|uniref:cholecystokinin receptor-like n=1 Tax=Chironomus tepperi TaxID=113505 RepID=UPI00391EF30D